MSSSIPPLPSDPPSPPPPPSPPAPQGGRQHLTAAVITAAATIIAAVIAAVAVSGGDAPRDEASAAGPVQTSAAASASPTPTNSPATPSDPPLQTLPVEASSATPKGRPRVVATPDRAAAGAVVTLRASGFAPDEQIRITFRDSGAAEADLRDVTAGPDGSFAAEVTVPGDEGDGSDTPVFRVWSLDDVDTDNQADTPFTVID
ncbi:hypothetical protein [Streptomyces sp. NBC_01012]|uniref:hypothetical protein n=1 Tax=Streptomyces sp. NBC_01012 TaxID=2903717 RepID=UPI00387014D9|nr:hypothetical protein OG623_14530 [Streptomyces sp. NBC_01012]